VRASSEPDRLHVLQLAMVRLLGRLYTEDMFEDDGVLFEGETEHGYYRVVDTNYSGRPARVLYSGQYQAAQSGLARDGRPDLLFDYNQRFMELVRGLLPDSVLIIGGGAFTLPKALIEEFPDMRLDVVELDGKLLDIAREYFEFMPSNRTGVYVGDGRKFLDSTKKKYDMIIVDAFTHTTIPESLTTMDAAATFAGHLTPNGVLAMNIIATYHGPRSIALKDEIRMLDDAFADLQVYPASSSISLWTPQNFILAAQHERRDLGPHIRYGRLELPAGE
jgi:spermidine synthase